MRMQDVLNALKRRLLPDRELLSCGMWCLRFDGSCHVSFLALGDTPISRAADSSSLAVRWPGSIPQWGATVGGASQSVPF